MRYLKVSLLIGFLSALLVCGLWELGAFHNLDRGLGNFLGLRSIPVSSPWAQLPLIILGTLGIAWTTVDIPRNHLKAIVAAAALAQVLSATWVLHLHGRFFSPFATCLAILVSFAAAFAYAQSEAGSRKKLLRAMFGGRISRQTFTALVDAESPLLLEGERYEATVVVCEIFNHDLLADTLPVTDYVALNNSFLRNAGDFLVEQGGYLDECDGESLRVVFGAPLRDTRHAALACEAALGLAARLDEVNRECRRMWKQTFDFRIGVNSGEIIVAAYGSRRLGAFSVAGEPVEWARRLCAANQIYGSRILLGSLAFQLAEGAVEARPMELVQRHPGERLREEVYELLARHDGLSPVERERRELFWKGVVYYREGRWDEAAAHFEKARQALAPEAQDAPIEFYLHRIEGQRGNAPVLERSSGSIKAEVIS